MCNTCPSNSRKLLHFWSFTFFILMLAGLLAMTTAKAEDDKFTLSGFGYKDYRQTTANIYEGADKRGTWDNGIIALVMSANLSDKDTVWAQIESQPSQPTEFTWAYLDHRFNDDLSVRVGIIKMPYGIYNEYIDNKALQLSAVRPSAYSFRADMVHDAYQGIGIDWTKGSLFSQLMYGKIYTPPGNGALTDAFGGRDRQYIGTRFTWSTPIEGLRFMFSSWDGQVEDNTGITHTPPLGTLHHELRRMYSMEYLVGNLDLKSEHNFHLVPGITADPANNVAAAPGLGTTGWYVQAGYKMGALTPYVRYDNFVGDDSIPNDPTSYEKEWVLGLNYKINSNMNARIEDHFIHGYGLPVTTQDMLPDLCSGGGTACPTVYSAARESWNMMAAEINFKF